MFWARDPELFLHSSKAGGDVHLWRCKKTSSSVVPMVPDDFKDEGKVTNYLDLVGNIFPWDKHYYQDLIDYICPRQLLVNVQGLVIMELYKSAGGKDGLIKINEKELPIYIRSLDVLSLRPYQLMERSIPSRTIQYLEDKNGKAAPMEEYLIKTPNEVKLENEVNREKSDNQALKKKLVELQDEIRSILKNKGQLVDEAWMNGHTAGEDWLSAEALYKFNRHTGKRWIRLTVIGSRTTFTMEDDSTNVQAKYFYKIQFDFYSIPMKAVLLQDLIPNKEKARFHKTWVSFENEGKMYVGRSLTAADRDNIEPCLI